MKAILVIIFLLLLPLSGYSLKQINSPTPALHSVFDKKPASEQRKYEHIRIAVVPVNNPDYNPHTGTPNGRDRGDRQLRIAKSLVVAGSIVTLVGAGCLIALVSDPDYDYDYGGFGLVKVATIGLCAIIACGLGMLIPGIIMRIKAGSAFYK